MPYLRKVYSTIDEYVSANNMKNTSPGVLIKQALFASDALLSQRKQDTNKTRIFLAESNSRPCGILVANAPKKTKSGSLTYSGRHNKGKKETELNYLVAWNECDKPKVKGVGKMIVNEYFQTLEHDNFKQVYVKSEIPEYSYATDFYKSLGFEFLSTKQENIEKNTSNKYLFKTADNPTDKICPMLIKNATIQKTISDISSRYNRTAIHNYSVDLEDVIK